MSADYYDTILDQRGLDEAFRIAADDARKRLVWMGDLEAETRRLVDRIEELERQIAEHRCQLPPSVREALNSGDRSYRP